MRCVGYAAWGIRLDHLDHLHYSPFIQISSSPSPRNRHTTAPLETRWFKLRASLLYDCKIRSSSSMADKETIIAASAKFPKPADRTFQYGTAGVCCPLQY